MAGKKEVETKDAKKAQALNDAIKQIEKQFGKGSVMKLGDRAAVDVAVIPTGSLTLDMALGIGGYPKGRIIEIYGPESSGKTTLTLHAIAEVQKQGGTAAFIDAEHAIDPVYAKNLGVNIDELILSQPDSGEQGLEIAETLVRSGAIDLVVVDSVAALVPQVELDGEMADQQMGLQARLMSKALRKLSGVMNKTDCTIIFINHKRLKEKANQDIAQSRVEALAGVKGEVADLTVLLAEKFMKQNLDAKSQSDLIDSYLDQLGDA